MFFAYMQQLTKLKQMLHPICIFPNNNGFRPIRSKYLQVTLQVFYKAVVNSPKAMPT
jgi:hypothetical protein